MPTRIGSNLRANRQQPEQDWQDTILQWAALYHWKAFFVPDWMYRLAIASIQRQPRKGRSWPDRGFPDLLLCKPPHLLFVECKDTGGKPTPTQLEWHELLRGCGMTVKVWTPKDIDEMIATLES
jgi:hypothetical protein